MSTNVTITPATREEVEPFFDGMPPYRLRAWIGKVDDIVLGLGGLYFLPDGTRVGFLVLTEHGKKHPKAVLKTSYSFLDTLRKEGVPSIRAVADPEIESAERFLLHVGFEATNTVDGQKIYLWHS